MSLEYNVPDWFREALDREFHGMKRIRWSFKDSAYHIEHKMGRAALPARYISKEDDAAIRLRDGYDLVMAIRPSNRMPCPTCGLTLYLPIREYVEVRCENCISKKRDGRVKAAYWPLDDTLLEHLRYTDPYRGGTERQIEDADRDFARRQRLDAQADHRENQALFRDLLLEQLPKAGHPSLTPKWAQQ